MNRTNPEVTPRFRLTAVEETEYWDAEYLKRIGTGRVWTVYLYEETKHAYLCEMTPSFEAYPAYFLTENHIESDTDQMDFYHEWQKSEDGVKYYHCHDVKALADAGNILADLGPDPTERDYMERVHDFISEMTCNGEPLWWDGGKWHVAREWELNQAVAA
jgi:hypothetical protein